MIDFDATVLAACETTFGQRIVYTSGEGLTYAVAGIFEQALKEVRPDKDGVLIDSARPILGMRVSTLLAANVPPGRMPTTGELITTSAPPSNWVISNAEPPDSEGHMRLTLMALGK